MLPRRRPSVARLFALTALCAVASLASPLDAPAQGFPPPPGPGAPPPGGNPICQRLEAQLASIDRGGEGGQSEQIRRYEDQAARQQAELDRATTQARRMGCESSGFFSLFNGQSAQCGPINSQIQQMRGTLDQITSNLARLRGSGNFEHDSQRRSVLLALSQNNCGPQYAAAARAGQPGNFLDNLFGGGGNTPDGPMGNTYRTVCVRSCDGFFFPISFATSSSRFADDERTCKKLCPAAEATLFTYRNPGEDMTQAVSLSGQPYAQSPNAFKYRQEFNPSCSCKAPGQSWADALKNSDDRSSLEQGDIVVTEDRAKQMSQPRDAQGRPLRQSADRKGAPAAPQGAVTPPPATAATPPAPNRPVRSVGPTFIPQ